MQPIVFGKYTLIERLGSGGMAEVFLAKTRGDKGLERLVAIKRIHGHLAADRKFTSMFIDEANIAAKLTHANIAQIFDLGKVDDQYFIAMEYVHGRDLRAIFRHHRALGKHVPIAQACYMGLKMCEGLDYAHNRKDYSGGDLGLVHRDVSLNNLILSFDGEFKIIDFGVAKAVGRSVRTETGFVKGKIAYMSPEQLSRRPLDRRSDVFACGIVLFEILTGRRLFSKASLRELVDKVRNAVVPPMRELNPDIPPALEAIVRQALARDRAKRYQSAGDLHDALLGFVQREGHYITRTQVASWMKELYAEHYEVESARIAELWAQTKAAEAAEEEAEAAASGDRLSAGGVGRALDPPTKIGWEPAAKKARPAPSTTGEVDTDVFLPAEQMAAELDAVAAGGSEERDTATGSSAEPAAAADARPEPDSGPRPRRTTRQSQRQLPLPSPELSAEQALGDLAASESGQAGDAVSFSPQQAQVAAGAARSIGDHESMWPMLIAGILVLALAAGVFVFLSL